MTTSGKILVIKPSSLGDIVHLFPALELLHRSFPEYELDYLIHPAFADMLDFSPFPVRRKIIFDRAALGTFKGFTKKFFSLLKEIRREKYDLVIDFQGLMRSGFFAWCARSRVCAGFANPTEAAATMFYNSRTFVKRDLHAVQRNVELVNGILNRSFSVPELHCPPFRRSILPELPEKYLVLIPGSRWESKSFPPKLFAEIFNIVHRKYPGISAVITGGKSDVQVAGELIKYLDPDAGVCNFTGNTTLVQLTGILAGASAAITNDSGPMHIAAFTATPVFAFFGPSDEKLTGPWGDSHRVFRREDLECTGCMKRSCPLEPSYLCHRIQPEKVAEKLDLILGKEFENL